MTYHLEGRMLEACSCDAICPCWVGVDPDGGRCTGTIAWHMDRGTIDGVDVSGLTIAAAADIPGNALKGNWKALIFIDERASQAQQDALLAVWSGQKGGPVADMAQLVGEIVGVERVPITFQFDKGKGRLVIGSGIAAEMEPLTGPTGTPTVLQDAAFSVIPGAPSYVGRTTRFEQNVPALGHALELGGHSAVQGAFVFDG